MYELSYPKLTETFQYLWTIIYKYKATTEKVSRYLIGSSNVNRFYKVEDFPSFKPCVMQKCCNIETFKVLMEELDDGDNEVMISVIENFICDEVNGEKEEKKSMRKSRKQLMLSSELSKSRLNDSKKQNSLPVSRSWGQESSGTWRGRKASQKVTRMAYVLSRPVTWLG